MLDTREASKILGVRENASKTEIENKFAILLKKYRMAGDTGGESAKAELEKIMQAYNVLMGYEQEPLEDEVNKKPNPLLQKLGVDEKKAGNFLYYYKYHIIIGIILVIVFVAALRSCIMRVDPDFNLAFIGDFHYQDPEPLRQAIKDMVPEITEPSIDGALLTKNMDAQTEAAMNMKLMVLLAAADIDVYILDKEYFERFAEKGAFMSLDDLVDTLNIDKEKNSSFILKAEETEAEHLYGVDISENQVFEDAGIDGDEKIAAIGVRAKNYDKAVKFLEAFLR